MERIDSGDGDSHRFGGGEIPGLGGQPAFVASGPSPSTVPVLIAVPHAGRAYPAGLWNRLRNPEFAAPRLEDRYVDRLAEAVARTTGAQLLVAQAPRAMIDLNRAPDDVDWEMFGMRPGASVQAPGHRSRSGLGLIPRRLPGAGELWNQRHEAAELAVRLAKVHEPYHGRLAQMLEKLRRRWGAALLIDLHSMPPLPSRLTQLAPEFVLGDRFGASCEGSLVGAAFAHLGGLGRRAAHNRPYAGGYVLERHGDPRAGVSALQIEVDRRLYLDSRLWEPQPCLADTAGALASLVNRLAGEVAALGQAKVARGWATDRWADAAE